VCLSDYLVIPLPTVLAIIRLSSFAIRVLIVAIGAHHDEEGNHKHRSIESRHQVSIPVQAYASDEK
jgi:hypothetical protein